jgi:4-hydroxy-L-threonine phosphate dehydrogenase PdxA
VSKARLLHQSLLRDLGVVEPRIAILGLNPHAGDGGTLGSEDKERDRTGRTQVERGGHIRHGPLRCRWLLRQRIYKHFDGVLAMYHDQGLAPFKALSFGNGVNFTAGLPIVRTSPDHGTGLDIAGKALRTRAASAPPSGWLRTSTGTARTTRPSE